MALDRRRRARILLLVTFLLFFVPIAGAWLLNIYAPDWRPFGTVNRGILVEPVRAVLAAGLAHADGTPLEADYLSGRWTVVHLGDGACDGACVAALARTRQVRKALGEDVHRVQRLLVGTDAAHAGGSERHDDLTFAVADSAWLASFSFPDAGGEPLPGVYLIDPQGYLMMRYPPDVEVRGLLADLERLLKISKIG